MKLSQTKTLDFAAALDGVEAEKPVVIPWLVVKRGDSEHEPVKAFVHALDIAAEGRARKFADTWAEEHGRKGARRGDEFWDEGFTMACVAEGYVDPDSPRGKPEPFIADPRELAGLHPMRLAYLFDHLDVQQSLVSPFTHAMSTDELMSKATEVANASDDAPFTALSPAMRWLFARGLACLLVASPEARLRFFARLSGTDPTPAPAA